MGLLDYDLLAFHVFSVSKAHLHVWLTSQILDQVTDFFDLVIDLTDFSAANELPMAWLKRSLQMCPPGILPCINVGDLDVICALLTGDARSIQCEWLREAACEEDCRRSRIYR